MTTSYKKYAISNIPDNLSPVTGKKIQPYLKGPIYWQWLHKAINLPGASLAVGLTLWHYRSLTKSLRFKVGLGDISKLTGKSKDAARRGLRSLQMAGLIQIERKPGRKSFVSLPPFS